MKRFLAPIAATALILTSLAGVAVAAKSPAPAVTTSAAAFNVDGGHSSVVFKIKHQKVANFYGRFNDVSGTFVLDAATPESSAIEIKVVSDSVDSANAKRDQHLKSADFFSVKEFPEITFKSTSTKKVSDGVYEVTGDLAFHGVTKAITAKVTDTGTGEGRGGSKIAGMEATFTIKRSEFGMNFMPGGLGEEVDLIVALEGGMK
ncbi:MAG: YceI family protein [bacterium]|nr:YceI family protein [bacterium]